jgi:hypothetical protein
VEELLYLLYVLLQMHVLDVHLLDLFSLLS